MKAARPSIPYVSARPARVYKPQRSDCAGLPATTLLFALATSALAQGILTVAPTRNVATIAGTGTPGDSGNGGSATAAMLTGPSAAAFDSAGNLYVADARNHQVREIVKATGNIIAVAGTGIEGYGGDGASATAAFLDTPTGIAVDADGNLYIADSHNHRIREVAGGIISTIAGSASPGFSGDGGAATLAQLYEPMGVAVDSQGNVYIADTKNHRVREVTGGNISTIAGDGEQLFAGDGAAATAAVLDSPTGVAVDGAGRVYVSDRHNQRIRMIVNTTISTVAGSGLPSFAAGFSGDGGPATAALLSRPSDVSVDSSGNVYIADTGNQRIRELGGGVIATIVGSGQQGFGGDGTLPDSVHLNAPRSVAPDAAGNLAVADRLNQIVRVASLPTLTFESVPVGTPSAPQSITLTNTGAASITVTSNTLSGPFAVVTGGTCSTLPVTLVSLASCTENISFFPVAFGSDRGSITTAGPGVVPQTVLLSGAALPSPTSIVLTSNANPALIGSSVTFTAVVTAAGTGVSTGTVTFYDGSSVLSVQPLASGSSAARFSDVALASGPHTLSAVYSGDTNFNLSTSNTLTETILDYSILLSPNSHGGGPGQSVAAGGLVVYSFNAVPIGGDFNVPVQLTATGLPPEATFLLTPNPVPIGAGTASFTLSIQTANPFVSDRRGDPFGGGAVLAALLMIPLLRSKRFHAPTHHPHYRDVLFLLSLGAIGGLSGCANSGFFGETSHTYTITVTGSATANAVTLQRSSIVTLTVH